jgi:putative ABC transport system permease protein
MRNDPALRGAELTTIPPFTPFDQDITPNPVGETVPAGESPSLWVRSITPGYFDLMRTRLVSGRLFTDGDRDGTQAVGIINEDAARRFWPGKDPVGRELARGFAPNAPRLTIVGVVAATRHDGPNQPYKPELFQPFEQRSSAGIAFVVEPSRDDASAIAAIRRAVKDVDALLPVSNITPIESMLGNAVALPRTYATLVGVFAGAALLLAVLGVYGVMAYAVSQRQREIGVRLALGAAPSGIRRMVLRQGGFLAALGVGLGLAAALFVGQLIQALLFGVTAFDAPTLVTVSLVLGAMTLLASWIPARRAMRVDPLSAMRND